MYVCMYMRSQCSDLTDVQFCALDVHANQQQGGSSYRGFTRRVFHCWCGAALWPAVVCLLSSILDEDYFHVSKGEIDDGRKRSPSLVGAK